MNMTTRIDELRLIGIQGTNKVMAGELSRLARRAFTDMRLAEPAKDGQGALAYPFDLRLACLAVRYHRTASRVLWGLYQSRAERLEPLYEELVRAVAADDRPWAWDGATLSVSVANMDRFPAGGRQVVGAVKNALIEGAARRGVTLRVDAADPDLFIDVRLHEERMIVAVDLAGRPMNQRGYRTDRGLAPLRENLAAVLVMLARHDARSEPLVDMMAGSGTIAIEGALMARGEPVWVEPRTPHAVRIPLFVEPLSRPAPPLFADASPLVIANELDPKLVRVTHKNLEAAGIAAAVEVREGDFRDIDPGWVMERARASGCGSGKGLLLSNPPYGERLRPEELTTLYGDLGRWCRQFPGWRAAFIVANPEFERAFGGRPRVKKPLNNGPLKGWFLQYEIA